MAKTQSIGDCYVQHYRELAEQQKQEAFNATLAGQSDSYGSANAAEHRTELNKQTKQASSQGNPHTRHYGSDHRAAAVDSALLGRKAHGGAEGLRVDETVQP